MGVYFSIWMISSYLDQKGILPIVCMRHHYHRTFHVREIVNKKRRRNKEAKCIKTNRY